MMVYILSGHYFYKLLDVYIVVENIKADLSNFI